MPTTKKKRASRKKNVNGIPMIPYATIVRFLGKPYGPGGEILTDADIDGMIKNQIVAPDPEAVRHGAIHPFLLRGVALAATINEELVASGITDKCLQVRVANVKPKGK